MRPSCNHFRRSWTNRRGRRSLAKVVTWTSWTPPQTHWYCHPTTVHISDKFHSIVLFSQEGKELVSSHLRVWVSTTVSLQTSTPTCATPPPAAVAVEQPPRRNLAYPPSFSRAAVGSQTLVNFTSTAGGCRRLHTAATEELRWKVCQVYFSTSLLCLQLCNFVKCVKWTFLSEQATFMHSWQSW